VQTVLQNPIAIRVQNLSISVQDKGRAKTLLSDVNFEIEQGKFVAVIGASGCGKSTLIKSLAGLIHPTSGAIQFADQTVQDLNAHLPLAVGYLPQFGAFHGKLTVGENLNTAAALRLPRQVTEDRRQAWMNHIVELARIDPLLPQEYSTLSGGQMRRMALAEELIGDPAFLLLDELTSGLDAFSDQEMMAWLRDLSHDMAKTVVLVTHATNNLHYCDAIMFLHQGRVVHYGAYQSLLDSHGVTSIAELFGIYQSRSNVPADFPEPERDPLSLNTLPPHSAEDGSLIKSLPPSSSRRFWHDRRSYSGEIEGKLSSTSH